MWDCLWLAPRIFTGTDGASVIDDAAIATQGGVISFVGPAKTLSDAPSQLAREVKRWPHGLITPGLIDCHTHLVFAGQRADEFEQRIAGASYAQIAAAGGGIARSVNLTRAASADDLYAQSLPRARSLLADGVTTIEIKSGYGLDFDTEQRMLKVARRLGRALGIGVRTTYLGLHALPPGCTDRNAYVDAAINDWLPRLAAEGLVDTVDAYHEGIAFTTGEIEALFAQAQRLNLPVRLHADQLANNGGGGLAARFSALSADHVEFTDGASIEAMAKAGTVAVLLPGAFLVLKETRKPPIDAFRAAGVRMAVATDLNPGTSPLQSLRTAMHLSISLFGLRVDEALAGAMCHAAAALGIEQTHGTLAVGKRADFVWWDAETPAELVYWIGGALAHEVIAGGSLIYHRRD